MESVILLFIVLLFVAVGVLTLRTLRDAPDKAELARLQTRDTDYQEKSAQLQELTGVVAALQIQNATLSADLDNERRVSAEKIQLLQEAEERLKKEFENLANRIFEDKGKSLTEHNKARMSELLQPFKEQLESFRNRVDVVHKEDTEQATQLLEQVRQLQGLSNKVSEDANNLAKAIKGDPKKQGDWGEMIVERIIEGAGLEKGREYDTQVSLKAEDGSSKRLDFIVYLPGGKAVIIDSKVSLKAYALFCEATEEEIKVEALAAHLDSVHAHIDELREKNYSHLLGNKTLDFVIMCVPNEPAYQAALKADPNLVYDLAKTNVVITGPTTLMITLKLIAQIWRRENENRNAEKIAERAGRMYDQVALIVGTMHEAQKHLAGTAKAFDKALGQLADGRGNLVGRVEELRKLGAKVSKQIPASVVEDAVTEDGDGNEDESVKQ